MTADAEGVRTRGCRQIWWQPRQAADEFSVKSAPWKWDVPLDEETSVPATF
jgi:hypothetical protein